MKAEFEANRFASSVTSESKELPEIAILRAGIFTLASQREERLEKYEQEREMLMLRRAALVAQFGRLSKEREIGLLDYEVMKQQSEKSYRNARYFFISALMGSVLAIVFGLEVFFFLSSTLVPKSLLIAGAATVALSLSWIAGGVLEAATGTTEGRPGAIKKLHAITVGLGGILLLSVLGLSVERVLGDSQHTLPMLIVGLELAAIGFSGASSACYRVFKWSASVEKSLQRLSARLIELDRQIRTERIESRQLLNIGELSNNEFVWQYVRQRASEPVDPG
jgi:hypothetical protein